MIDPRRLAIVIPIFTGEAQLRRCLASLYSSQDVLFTIYLVNHAASDEISQWVGSEFPDVRCIRGYPDLWWAEASNLGIKQALEDGNQYVMLLNHDCYVRSNTVSLLLKHALSNPRSLVAPAQHRLQSGITTYTASTCFLLGFPTLVWPGWVAHKVQRKKNGLISTKLILGGRGTLIDARIFLAVGLLDSQHFPHYGADHDFYLRCRKNGYQLFVSTDAIVDVDDTKTSLASSPKALSFREFKRTFTDRRSHRNVKDLYSLFSRYYPVPLLAGVGVAFNLARYTILFIFGRLFRN